MLNSLLIYEWIIFYIYIMKYRIKYTILNNLIKSNIFFAYMYWILKETFSGNGFLSANSALENT